MYFTFAALCAALLGSTVASPIHDRRQTCTNDKVLQALEAPENNEVAAVFCSAYITAVTTVTATTTIFVPVLPTS
jgi:hypothetical protein